MPPPSPRRSVPAVRRLRLGFLALTDAAPLVVAREKGLFAARGLEVALQREVGWATIREKVIHGELDAAPAPAPLLWSAQLGIGCVATRVLTALVLNRHGNAFTLSNRLWAAGVRDAAALRTFALARRGAARLTFGVVYPHSSHHLHLRTWLLRAGIDPEHDVRIVVVPPDQMFRTLQAGAIDGYWAGEPWTSIAVRADEGWCAEWSAAFAPGHIEKVLLVTERFAAAHPQEHAGLVAALHEAARWCDQPENRPELAALLSSSTYLNVPLRVITPALLGDFDCGHGRHESIADFHIFSGGGANLPTATDAAALQSELIAAGILPQGIEPDLPARLFREDLHRTFVGLGAARPAAEVARAVASPTAGR